MVSRIESSFNPTKSREVLDTSRVVTTFNLQVSDDVVNERVLKLGG